MVACSRDLKETIKRKILKTGNHANLCAGNNYFSNKSKRQLFNIPHPFDKQ